MAWVVSPEYGNRRNVGSESNRWAEIPPVPLSSCVESVLLLICKMRMIPPTKQGFLRGSEEISYMKAASMVPDLITSLSPHF